MPAAAGSSLHCCTQLEVAPSPTSVLRCMQWCRPLQLATQLHLTAEPAGKSELYLQDFQQATGEVVESFSESSDDGTSKGPQTSSTTSRTAGTSEGGPNSHSFSDMVRSQEGQVACMGALDQGAASSAEAHLCLACTHFCA